MPRTWTIRQLRQELKAFDRALELDGKARTTIDQYVDVCERFVSWLEPRQELPRPTTGARRDVRRTETRVPFRDGSAATPGRLELSEPVEIAAFTWKWPATREPFVGGWEFEVQASGRVHRVRHAFTEREAFGRKRRRTVTWIDGQVQVEGVETEDYATSRLLASVIKPNGKRHLGLREAIPDRFRSFQVVPFNAVVVGPNSFRSLAVVIPEDDREQWTRFALLRMLSKSTS